MSVIKYDTRNGGSSPRKRYDSMVSELMDDDDFSHRGNGSGDEVFISDKTGILVIPLLEEGKSRIEFCGPMGEMERTIELTQTALRVRLTNKELVRHG